MSTRESVARALQDLPSGVVRWASAPRESLPRRTTGVAVLDTLLGGGWTRGRMSVLRAAIPGAGGRTTLAVAAVAATTAEGRTAAWIDGDASLDPVSLAAAGADLSRILWVRGPLSMDATLAAAEEILAAGDFAVTVVQPPEGSGRTGAAAGWIRLARGVERARAVLLVLDRGGTAAAAGGVVVRVGTLRGRWAGRPGPGSLLLEAEAPVEADEGTTALHLPVAEALECGDSSPPCPGGDPVAAGNLPSPLSPTSRFAGPQGADKPAHSRTLRAGQARAPQAPLELSP